MKLTLPLMAMALTASATPIQQPATCPTMQGVYCDSLMPDLQGMLLAHDSNGAMGLVSWLSPQAETDYTIYFGPVTMSGDDWWAYGIPGIFAPTVNISVEGVDRGTVAPEPNAWALIVAGLIGMAVAVLVRCGLRGKNFHRCHHCEKWHDKGLHEEMEGWDKP